MSMAAFLPYFEELEHAVDKARDTWGVRPFRWPPLIAGLLLIFIALIFFPSEVKFSLSLALFLAPLWLPLILIAGAWSTYLVLIRSEFIASKPYVLLEIKVPRNLVKTPLAMEAVFSGINFSKGESNWFQILIQGQVRPYWSFEIASIEGEVHFFVWTRADVRLLLENAMYAQYPGVQLVEATDYTRIVSAKPEEWSVWGCDYKHTNAIDAYPIKTYVEYGLDKTQEEPEQVDPFAHLVEFAGSIGKGEYLWLQFIIRPHGGEKFGSKPLDKDKYTWRTQAKEVVEQIREQIVRESKSIDPETKKMVSGQGFPTPTKWQTDTVAAIERNVSKLPFDVGGRSVYVAKPSNFNPAVITGMIHAFKPFNVEGWNGIKATHFGLEFSDYPWEIGNERRKDIFRRHVVDAFRRRQYFHQPFEMPDPMVMSTEELATIYHIPSSAIATPGLRRIPSVTAEAPPNLPT
jgi:hypothetical protein